jgi:uncharacterized protein (DUF2141 family)
LSLLRTAFLLPLLAAGLVPGEAGSAQPGAGSDCGGPPSATRLFVNVESVGSARGLVAVTLYADNPRKFLAKRGALYVVRVPARAGRTRACVHVPAPGVYALAVYHDSNANRSFDRRGIGLPAEAYGFSNNPKTFMGMPAFSSVRLRVTRDGAWTNIHLNDP